MNQHGATQLPPLDEASLLIVEDFEKAWLTGRPEIEPFFVRHPSRPLQLLVELAAIDMENRAKRGEDATPQRYEAAFPQLAADPACAAELRRAHAHGRPDVTTNHEPGRDDSFGLASGRLADEGLTFLQPPTAPGTLGTLAHYTVIRRVGQGAFGSVFEAFDEKLHRRVAIKVLSPQLATTSPPRKRFVREARSMAAVSHENVVRVYSVEEQPVPHLVMEFVDGQTLQDRMDGVGPFDVSEVVHISRQVAAALAAAHETGLIHRDVKPSNVLLSRGPGQVVKLTDFGLARAADDASMTGTGTLLGTPLYMSPEQADGGSIDHRTDLFSLGSLMYVMISGRPPFRASSITGVLKRLVDETPRPIGEIIPEVPRWIVDLISRLHAKKPEERIQTARKVEEILGNAQRRGIEQAPANLAGLRADASAGVPRPARPSRGWAAGLAAAGLVAAALLGWRTWGPGTSGPTPSRPGARGAAEVAQPVDGDAGMAARPAPASGQAAARGSSALVVPTGWEPGPAVDVLPGIVANPTVLPGIARWQAIARLPSSQMTSIDFSSCGQLAVGTDDGLVRIYDAASMELLGVEGPVARIPADNASVVAVFSPDGAWLATTGYDAVRFRNIASGRSTKLKLPWWAHRSISWHPDGERIAVCGGQKIMLVERPADDHMARVVGEWPRAGEAGDLTDVECVAWSPDGTRLACAGRASGEGSRAPGGVVLLDKDGGFVSAPPVVGDKHPGVLKNAAAWSPDGRRLAVGSEHGTVQLLPVDGGEPMPLPFVSSHARVLRWHPDGDRLLCGFPNAIFMYRTQDPSANPVNLGVVKLGVGPAFGGDFNLLAIDRDGHSFAYAESGTTLRVNSILGNVEMFDAAYPREDENRRDQIRWTADGRLVVATGAHPNSIRVLSPEGLLTSGPWQADLDGRMLRVLPHPSLADSLALHAANGRVSLVSPDGSRRTIMQEAANVPIFDKGVAWSPTGNAIVDGHRGRLQVQSATDGRVGISILLPQPIAIREAVPLAIAGTAMEWLVATAVGDSSSAMLFQIDPAGTVTGSTPLFADMTDCSSLSIDPAMQRVSAIFGLNGVIPHVAKLADGTSRPLEGHTWQIRDMSWSKHDGTLVTAGLDGRCFVWDVEAGTSRCFDRWRANEQFASAAADPVTGRIAVKTMSNVVHCFDPESLAVRWSLTTLPDDGQATFSAGGALLHGDVGLVEKHLAYVVDHDDGRREVVSHGDFLRLAEAARDPATRAAARPHPARVEERGAPAGDSVGTPATAGPSSRQPPAAMVEATATAGPASARGNAVPGVSSKQRPARPAAAGAWPPGPSRQAMPGIVTNPTLLPGVDRWQAIPRLPSVELAGIDFSPQGQLAVASRDGLVRVFDVTRMDLTAVVGPHRRVATGHAAVALRFSPDGQWLASAGRDGIRFWHSTTGLSTGIGGSNGAGARAVSWHPSGDRIAVAYEREVVFVGLPADGGLPRILGRWKGGDQDDGFDGVTDVSWSPDGTRVAVAGYPRNGRNKTTGVILLDQDGTRVGSLPEADENSPRLTNTSVAWSPDGSRIAVGSYGGGVRLLPVDGSQPVQLVADATFSTQAEVLRWHPDGRRLFCGMYADLISIDASDPSSQPVRLVRDASFSHDDAPQRLSISPDGQTFAYAAGGTCLRIVRCADGAGVFDAGAREAAHPQKRDTARWSADGRLVVATGAGPHAIRVLDADGMPVREPWKTAGLGEGMRVHPHPTDTGILAAHSLTGDVGILAADGSRQSRLALPGGKQPRAAAWMPDGGRLAVAARGSTALLLFDRSGDAAGRITLPQPLWSYYEVVPFAARASAAGAWFGAAAGDDGVAMLVRTDATQAVVSTQPVLADRKQCRGIAIAPDGEWVAALYPAPASTNVYAVCPSDGLSRVLSGHSWWVNDIDWAHRGTTLISAGLDGRCFAWNPQTNESRSFDRHDANDMFVAASADPVSGRIAVKTSGGVVHGLDPTSLAPLWSFVILSDESHATFSPGGTLVHGDETAVDKHLAYVVDHKDGRREVLSHARFLATFGEANESSGAVKAAADR